MAEKLMSLLIFDQRREVSRGDAGAGLNHSILSRRYLLPHEGCAARFLNQTVSIFTMIGQLLPTSRLLGLLLISHCRLHQYVLLMQYNTQLYHKLTGKI